MNKNETIQQIRQIIEDWAMSVRTEDLDGILAHHSDDIVMFDLPEPLQSKGIAAYKQTWDLYFSFSEHSGVFDVNELDITAGDDVAFCHATMKCAGKTAGGENVEYRFRLTTGLRKMNGRWVITHEHHSLPSQ